MITSSYLGYEPPDFANDQSQTGYWCRIVAEPDTFTGERFNVGVGIVDNAGNRLARVITERGRLECAFGASDAESILMMADIAKKCFEAGTAPLFQNVLFDVPVPLLNRAPTVALDELFFDQVTFALPQRVEAARPAGWLTREETRDKVYQLIRERVSANSANFLIPQAQDINVKTKQGAAKSVKVPLQPLGGAAGLESACYTTATVKAHLMDAMLDLQAYASANDVKHTGMFVLRPTKGLSQKSLLFLDNTIDDVLWRAPRNWNIQIEEDPVQLADKIVEWAHVGVA
ncbi:hypothetical protein [Massilia sp. TWP1-3-3]|uniref:hypothetical protein n=1 Tax=Massilia sp. TWP1-3-3 TaxID=2804573 RepID=UPI003CEC611B